MLKGYIFKEQTFNNEVCALIFNEYLNNSDGVFGNYKNGMAVTKSGSNVTIANGIGIIKGRAVGEDSSTTLDAGTTEMYCKLVIEMDLDKINTSSSFLQASYKILKSSSAYPSLTQDNIIGTNSGVYQYELARFRTTANGITDFQDMRTFIDIPTMYEQIVQMVQNAIDSIEDGSAFALKADVQGTVLYDGQESRDFNVNDDPVNYGRIELIDLAGRVLGRRIGHDATGRIEIDRQHTKGGYVFLDQSTVEINGRNFKVTLGNRLYWNGSAWLFEPNTKLKVAKVIGYKY